MLTKLLGMKVSSLVSTGEMIEDKLQGEELLLDERNLRKMKNSVWEGLRKE